MTTRGHLRARAAGHRVADFNNLDDLIAHARDFGATHTSGEGARTKIYFPLGRGPHKYEEATVWRKESFWHAQGPGSRNGVSKLPSDARSIGAQLGRRAAEGRRAPRHVRDYEAIDRQDRVIAGPFKSYGDAKDAAGSAGAVRFVPSRGRQAPPRASEMRSVSPTANFESGFAAAVTLWNNGSTLESISHSPDYDNSEYGGGMRAAVEALSGWYDAAERTARAFGLSREEANKLVHSVDDRSNKHTARETPKAPPRASTAREASRSAHNPSQARRPTRRPR